MNSLSIMRVDMHLAEAVVTIEVTLWNPRKGRALPDLGCQLPPCSYWKPQFDVTREQKVASRVTRIRANSFYLYFKVPESNNAGLCVLIIIITFALL